MSSDRILLPSSKLTRCLEIDSEICKFAFVIFGSIFDCVNMEWDCEPMHWQDDRLSLAVNIYLWILVNEPSLLEEIQRLPVNSWSGVAKLLRPYNSGIASSFCLRY
jgi:hypothetical protein